VVAARPLYAWISMIRREPGVPLSVHAIYRPLGDIQYYPLIGALSRLTLGDGVLLERYRTGFGAFPIVGLLPHALLFGALGAPGLVVADVLVSLAFYLALAALLRLLGLSVGLARAAAALTATGALQAAWNGAVAAQLLPAAAGVTLWGNRIPRTFTTDVVVMLTLGALVAVARTPPPEQEPRRWAVLGLCFGALLQSDVYASMTLAIDVALVAAFVGLELRGDPRRVARAARCAGACAAATLVVALPFLAQQAFAHPDVARRLGVFRLPRGRLVYEVASQVPRLRLFGVALAVALAAAPWHEADPRARRLGRSALIVAGSAPLALAALPISVLVLGKTIQPYHFRELWLQLSAYGFVLIALLFARGLFASLGRRWTAPWWSKPSAVAAGPLLAAAVVLAGIQALEKPAYYEAAVRFDFEEYGRLQGYRRSFAGLVRELSSERYRDARVLGTLDHQVYVYWTTFQHRFVLAADPFASTADDQENERRLMRMLKLVGASGEELERLLSENAVLVLFLGHAKYAISPLYHLAPAAEYPPWAQREIASGPLLSSWKVALPSSEKARLLAAYARLTEAETPFAPPDIVVLTTHETARGLRPDATAYEPTYRDEVFTVWKRR
jgi:hypothetical protein